MRSRFVVVPSIITTLIVLVLSLSFAAPVQGFCVALLPSPGTVTLSPGQTTTVSIGITTTVNFDYGTETFSATGLPQQVTATFSPSTIPYNNGYSGTSTLTLNAGSDAPVDTYIVTLHLVGNGPDSGAGNTATITVVVSQPTPEFPAVPLAVLVTAIMTLAFAMISVSKRKPTNPPRM
jgi:uncharacterized membrane protein